MYSAGYADGYATAARIREAFDNFNESEFLNETTGRYIRTDWPESWKEWINQNIAYVRAQVHTQAADAYWVRTGLILAQFDGLMDGYNARASEIGILPLREVDFWLVQAQGDLGDLEEILSSELERKDPELRGHCTALIRLAPGNSDIFFSHTTWTDVRSMHAYLKEYTFNVPEFAAHRVSISTRTGMIGSVDDFWTNDRGLLVFETTLQNFNETLYDLYVKPESVLTWIRSYHAMLATSSGPEWALHFARENSGTYNNEYVILDTKKWEAGKTPASDLIWMTEQMPGITVSRDVTPIFAQKGYIEGVNAPQFAEIWNISAVAQQQQKDPARADFYSVSGQIRDKLIVRDAPGIQTYEAFQWFMQYNDYLHDDLMIIPGTNQREPAQGILSRYDLRPENGTNWGSRRHFGGLDVKTVRVNTWTTDHIWDAKLGMTQNLTRGIPPFNFSDWPAIGHRGLAEVGVYPWTPFVPGDLCAVLVKAGDEKECGKITGCGFCIPTQKCMMGSRDGPDPFIGNTCDVGWSYEEPLAAWVIPTVAAVSSVTILFVILTFGLHFFKEYRRTKGFDKFRL
jgi:hypothetical protein